MNPSQKQHTPKPESFVPRTLVTFLTLGVNLFQKARPEATPYPNPKSLHSEDLGHGIPEVFPEGTGTGHPPLD